MIWCFNSASLITTKRNTKPKVQQFQSCLCINSLRYNFPLSERYTFEQEEAKHWTVLQFLQFIIKWDFVESLPYLTLTLRFFLTICVSVASCERSFSKMKLIKNYLRSTMSQSRLSDLAVLSIENELTRQTDFDDVIDQFATMKTRKHSF